MAEKWLTTKQAVDHVKKEYGVEVQTFSILSSVYDRRLNIQYRRLGHRLLVLQDDLVKLRAVQRKLKEG